MKFVFAAPSSDDLIRLLKAWRFWALGAVFGALIGAAVYFIAPPPYRARATVNVDFHLEQAWPQNTDREQFYYLERETRKLELIAESDEVLEAVTSQVTGVTVRQLREEILQHSQPGNGGWHFYADHRDPQKASALASAWAQAFTAAVYQDVIAAADNGLEPYITVSLDQTQNLPVQRRLSLSDYLFAGALIFLALGAFGILFLDARP
jgi:capsular polysaccharide biosynthesis protein